MCGGVGSWVPGKVGQLNRLKTETYLLSTIVPGNGGGPGDTQAEGEWLTAHERHAVLCEPADPEGWH